MAATLKDVAGWEERQARREQREALKLTLKTADRALDQGRCKATLYYFEVAARRGATTQQLAALRQKLASNCLCPRK